MQLNLKTFFNTKSFDVIVAKNIWIIQMHWIIKRVHKKYRNHWLINLNNIKYAFIKLNIHEFVTYIPNKFIKIVQLFRNWNSNHRFWNENMISRKMFEKFYSNIWYLIYFHWNSRTLKFIFKKKWLIELN